MKYLVRIYTGVFLSVFVSSNSVLGMTRAERIRSIKQKSGETQHYLEKDYFKKKEVMSEISQYNANTVEPVFKELERITKIAAKSKETNAELKRIAKCSDNPNAETVLKNKLMDYEDSLAAVNDLAGDTLKDKVSQIDALLDDNDAKNQQITALIKQVEKLKNKIEEMEASYAGVEAQLKDYHNALRIFEKIEGDTLTDKVKNFYDELC